MTIIFRNPGEIDIRLISTFGANVKEGDSPIGFFGTGLKYAIAVLLREGHELSLSSGLTTYTFTIKSESIRGKDFDIIHMNNQPLGFTTELGKNWTVENAYRELYCNMVDEDGEMDLDSAPCADQTVVVVTGPSIELAHRNRDSFILAKREPLYRGDHCEIYSGGSGQIFYRGIAVCKLREASLYTYNVLCPVALTEDRTAKSEWAVLVEIANILNRCTESSIVSQALSSKETFEFSLSFDYITPTDLFLDTVGELQCKNPLSINKSALDIWIRNRKKDIDYDQLILSPEEQKLLEEAIAFCESIGFEITRFNVFPAQDLGKYVVGLAKGETIYLAPKAFVNLDTLCATLIEEFIHLNNQVADCSREFQDVLFGHIIRLGRKALSERIAPANELSF